MIIIEGHDNSGKSTLARVIKSHPDFSRYGIQESEGPPVSPAEINERCERYMASVARGDKLIWVRHPVISNAIYGSFRPEGDVIRSDVRAAFHAMKPLLIYCDPMERGLGDHVVKDHDTEEHLALLQANSERILGAYRQWALKEAHVIYRIGDDVERIIRVVRPYA